MTIQVDERQACALLTALHPNPSTCALVRLVAMKGKDVQELWYWSGESRTAVIAEALDLNTKGYNIFVNVNPMKTMANGNLENVAGVHALPLDIDVVKNRINIHKIYEAMYHPKIALLPSVCVVSGYGAHIYFLLDRIYTVEESAFYAEVLCDTFRSDRVDNANRIMRLPGTWNWKKSAPSPCYIVEQSNKRYSLEQIHKRMEETEIIVKVSDETFAQQQEQEHENDLGTYTPEEVANCCQCCDLRPETLAAIIAKVEPYIQDIIKTGKAPTGWKRTKSEIDYAVCMALLRQATVHQIQVIYFTYPVAFIKAADSPMSYLERTIKAAYDDVLEEFRREVEVESRLRSSEWGMLEYVDGRIRVNRARNRQIVEAMLKGVPIPLLREPSGFVN